MTSVIGYFARHSARMQTRNDCMSLHYRKQRADWALSLAGTLLALDQVPIQRDGLVRDGGPAKDFFHTLPSGVPKPAALLGIG